MSKKPANHTSYTELSTLTQCEMKWHLRYREGLKGDDSEALALGRLLDGACAVVVAGGDWEAWMRQAVAEEGADASLVRLEACDDPIPRATWLMHRYVEQYGVGLPEGWTLIATQLDLLAAVPGTTQVHRAIVDEVWEDDNGEWWMVERKSYGRRDRLFTTEVDPQLTLNLWVCQQNYPDRVWAGIIFDGIYTYRWKAEKPTQAVMLEEALAEGLAVRWDHPMWDGRQGTGHPTGPEYFPIAGLTKTQQRDYARLAVERHPGVDRLASESFDRLPLDRTPEHIDAALDEVRASIQRRNALRRGATPQRNLSSWCKNCAQRPVCWDRLAFPLDEVDNIDVED